MAKRSVKCNQLVPVSPFTWHEKCTLAMRLNQILVADVQILDILLSLFQIKEKYWNTKFTWKMKLIWTVVCVFEKGSFQRNKTFKGAVSINLASHRDDECMENSTCQTIFYDCSVRLQPVELINSQSSNLHTFTTPFEKLFVPKTQSVSQSQKKRTPQLSWSRSPAEPQRLHRSSGLSWSFSPCWSNRMCPSHYDKSSLSVIAILLPHSNLLITLQDKIAQWMCILALERVFDFSTALQIFPSCFSYC